MYKGYNCVTFGYSIEFAWLTTHVNLFHLEGRRKKNTGQVTYQVMVMEVKTEKNEKEKTIGRSQIELSLNVSI